MLFTLLFGDSELSSNRIILVSGSTVKVVVRPARTTFHICRYTRIVYTLFRNLRVANNIPLENFRTAYAEALPPQRRMKLK